MEKRLWATNPEPFWNLQGHFTVLKILNTNQSFLSAVKMPGWARASNFSKIVLPVLALSISSMGQTFEPRWITNSVHVAEVKINGNTYTNASIRKAASVSVMIRHDGGFFSTAITNLPKSVLTNLVFIPAKEVRDFVSTNRSLEPTVAVKLLRGEVELSKIREDIAWAAKKQEDEFRAELDAKKRARLEAQEAEESTREEWRTRVRKYAKLKSLPVEIAMAVEKKDLVVGMTEDDVQFILGKPDGEIESVDGTGSITVWKFAANPDELTLRFRNKKLFRFERVKINEAQK